jgi:hypothetical protein
LGGIHISDNVHYKASELLQKLLMVLEDFFFLFISWYNSQCQSTTYVCKEVKKINDERKSLKKNAKEDQRM